MKTRRWPSFLLTAITIFCFSSCHEWGQWDPPAGNQIFPKLQLLKNYAFESLEDAGLDLFTYENGRVPEIVFDEEHGNVLNMNGGYARTPNPFLGASLQKGGTFTFWVKLSQANEEGALFSIANEENTSRLNFAGNGSFTFQSPDGAFSPSSSDVSTVSGLLIPDKWHYIALIVNIDGYHIYINGESAVQYESVDFDFTGIIRFMVEAPYLYLGYGSSSQPGEVWLDDLKVYRNIVTAKEISTPIVKPPVIGKPTPVYINTFDAPHTAQIVGNGSFETVSSPGFGKVFRNATGGMRQNYLLLPNNVLSHSSETREMSIGMWVNAVHAGESQTYMWSPLFTAYNSAPPEGGNGAPMFALQYRGAMMINNNGWCDFTDIQNVKGANTILHGATDWLADGQWHHYMATITETTAKVYFDGQLINEWQVDGQSEGQTIKGLFDHGSDYTYICLGGNQAWNWVDPDPGFMFDDFVIYDTELSENDIKTIIESKSKTPIPSYINTFEAGLDGARIMGDGQLTTVTDKGFGTVFKNATGGMRQNYLLLPENALSHSTQTNQMSIAVWVNASEAGPSNTYMWSPLFSAYAGPPANNENGMPMFILQYRGVAQVNNQGWCDFTDAQNVKGANTILHNETDWLADGQWHLYTATFTEVSAKIYFDGGLINEWRVDGSSGGNVIRGLFSHGADLKHICLGGNQAWSWADPDPGFMFDDIAIYNFELTPDQISFIMENK